MPMRPFLVVACFGLSVSCAQASPAPTPAPKSRGEFPCGASVDSFAARTSATTTVCGDDLNGIPATQLESLLEGRVAGVEVVQVPGGGLAVRIRGRGSIHGDINPLYVVDGMPVRVEPDEGLSWLNPGDIQRIEFLKDAGATAIYGMRGANGVVLITTRRGRVRDSKRK